MGDARAAFIDAASTAVQLLERPELAEHWIDGSVLQQLSAAGLAVPGETLRQLGEAPHGASAKRPVSDNSQGASDAFKVLPTYSCEYRHLRWGRGTK
jgi:hypothetical protein